MIELGILGAIAEWLAPLPDRSLPNIKIRETLIDSLKDVTFYFFTYINYLCKKVSLFFVQVWRNKRRLFEIERHWQSGHVSVQTFKGNQTEQAKIGKINS